jgi:hypothetical protein
MGQASADFDQDGDWDVAVAVLGESTVAVAMSNVDPTGVDEYGHTDPARVVRLHQSRPNPFYSSTLLAFDLLRPSRVTLQVYDTSGRLVRTLLDDEERNEGLHETFWDGRDGAGCQVASGVYFCRAALGSDEVSTKLVLIR